MRSRPAGYRHWGLLWLWLWLSALSGCMEAGNGELQAWMQAERNTLTSPLEPLPASRPFTPQAYVLEPHQDPFGSERLSGDWQAQPVVASRQVDRFRVDQDRQQQPLEAFPLDSMVMVGTISSPDQRVALVQVEQSLYLVRSGHYMGQNHGRVSRITDQGIELRETVQDARGVWIERAATLPLQEKATR